MTSVVLEGLSFFPMAGLKVLFFFYILIAKKNVTLYIKDYQNSEVSKLSLAYTEQVNSSVLGGDVLMRDLAEIFQKNTFLGGGAGTGTEMGW